MKKVLLLLLIMMVLFVMVVPLVAYAADAIPPADPASVIQVLKDYLPLLAVLLFFLGQALKKIPNFAVWLLPFVMAGIGLLFGLVIGMLGGGTALDVVLATVEGIVAGLASTGINEAKKQAVSDSYDDAAGEG
jgi:hypothetical protein